MTLSGVCHARVSCILIGLGLCLISYPLPSVYAQPSDSVQSSSANMQEFHIDPQPLGSAVTAFAAATRYQVLYGEGIRQDVQSKGVHGLFRPEEALKQLLEGTGVQYRFTGEKTFTLEQSDTSQIVPPIPAEAQSMADSGTTSNDSDTKLSKPIKVPEVVVKDVKQRETTELNNLPPDYAGGQVASGGRVGILGNRNIMDTPFTQMNYTSKLIQDQQARFLGDVVKNDPSVQLGLPTASGFSTFAIRGFSINFDAGDTFFNGLMAIAPAYEQTMMTESIERVEVLRGPSALLTGATPGGAVGGMINLIPKRAGDEALTRITAQYLSDTQGGGHVDLGRRFGSHKQFGIRINGVYRNGNLPIDHASR